MLDDKGEQPLVTFAGVVGEDENAKEMAEAMKKSGVTTKYAVAKGEKTGYCHIPICGKMRCIGSFAGAALKVPSDFLGFIQASRNSITHTDRRFCWTRAWYTRPHIGCTTGTSC